MLPSNKQTERQRLEALYKAGKLTITARREAVASKSYNDYKQLSQATNKRIFSKYGAKPGAKPPMNNDSHL